ncbi:MAG: STAS domain-containing protein [Planctomycetes bacterium]|nr:STAS domain-containing protein [Planctomycetota bacterium]
MADFGLTKKDLAGGVVLLDVQGYLDAHTFEQLDDAIEACFKGGKHRLIAKLDKVGYISSAGAGVFIGAIGKAKEKQGDIVLLSPSPNVREVFDLLGLTRVFHVVATLNEALAKFGAA